MPLKLAKREGSPFFWLTGTIGGVRVRESTQTDRRDLAEIRRAARENELYRASIHGPVAVKLAFAAVAESYIQHGGPHSQPTMARVLRVAEHFGPKMDADAVDQQAIDRACVALLRPGSSPATRLREIVSPVRAVLIHGSRRRMCAVPLFDVGRPSASRTEWLTPAEVDALISAASTHLKPLLTFLVATGARVGEALGLRWRDVDLTHKRAVLRDTKNGRDRPLDLCPRAVAALGLIVGRTEHVFRTRAGKPYRVWDESLPEAERKAEAGGGQIKKGWATAQKAAGLDWKQISPHSLRHTWASWHYAMHRDPLLLRFEGDWSSVKLVERYAHLAPMTMTDEVRAWRASEPKNWHTADTLEKQAAD